MVTQKLFVLTGPLKKAYGKGWVSALGQIPVWGQASDLICSQLLSLDTEFKHVNIISFNWAL